MIEWEDMPNGSIAWLFQRMVQLRVVRTDDGAWKPTIHARERLGLVESGDRESAKQLVEQEARRIFVW